MTIANTPLDKQFDEDAFRLKLITAQYELRENVKVGRPRGLLVLVNGIETSGKGKAVSTLREWVDPRLLKVTYLDTKTPAKCSPIWQRHAFALPRHGEITVMFGNWYADLIHAYVNNHINNKELEVHLNHIELFEKDLQANDTHVLKCWFDISDKTLKKRLNDDKDDPEFLYHIDWNDKKQVKKFRELFAHISKKQQVPNNSQISPINWFILNGEDKKIVNQEFCQTVYQALIAPVHERKKAKRPFPNSAIPKALLNPSDQTIDKQQYKTALKEKQKQLAELIRKKTKEENKNIVLLFEGMDAAGKGGAIKRVVSQLDPREYQIHNIAAPEPVELQHPYLWRFWHRLPNEGELGIFDRSWYGRILVERVEAFARQDAWQEAFDEINRFEHQLTERNTIVLKFWLAIGMDTQLERFKERENTPHKRFKITPDDWRNRDRWEDYVQAAADMLERTNNEAAPWHIIATNDKYSARIMVLDACIESLT